MMCPDNHKVYGLSIIISKDGIKHSRTIPYKYCEVCNKTYPFSRIKVGRGT